LNNEGASQETTGRARSVNLARFAIRKFGKSRTVLLEGAWPMHIMISTKEDLMKLLSQKELAVFLGVSTRTVERYRASGSGPRYFKLGKSVRYDETDVLDWVLVHQGSVMPGPVRT
jgi:predicted DNA-binding transcriptional regulator AlpA